MGRGGYGSATSPTTHANRAVRLSVSKKKPRFRTTSCGASRSFDAIVSVSGPLTRQPKHITQAETGQRRSPERGLTGAGKWRSKPAYMRQPRIRRKSGGSQQQWHILGKGPEAGPFLCNLDLLIMLGGLLLGLPG